MNPTGVKALGVGKPTEAELVRMDRAVEVIRVRYQRWTRWRTARILSATRSELMELEDPTEADIIAAVMRRDKELEDTMRRMLAEVYPMASALCIPDGIIKSWTPTESKAVDAKLWDLVQRLVGRSIDRIDSTTLEYVRRAYYDAGGDVQVFRRLLLASPAFSPARARTIAVTETNVGINDALYRVSEDVADGRELMTIWRTTMQLNVRDTHKVMEGKAVLHGECFHVPLRKGGYDLMLHPGDSSHGAHPENIINCHCKGFSRFVA